MTRPDATARRREVALAGHGAPEPATAPDRARAGLADPEPAVRATALGALARLGRLTMADIEAAFGDPAEAVRCRAAELAARFGPEAAPLLSARLQDRRADVVEAACFGLGELGPGAGRAEIDGLTVVAKEHSDPLCREAAVAAIGAIAAASAEAGTGAPDGPAFSAGRAAILAAMADKPAVRRRAVLALSPFEGPDVDAALETALADRDWQVRQAAEDMTGRRRPT